MEIWEKRAEKKAEEKSQSRCGLQESLPRIVVNLMERTCTCKIWQGSGIPCKHVIAYITSIPGAILKDYMDEYYSVEKFKVAYEDSIPSTPDKSNWPRATHGFFMHPPLHKATTERRKNKIKSALEEGNSGKKRHECPICHELGHHWYTCNNRNPEDIAAMEAAGVTKEKLKKTAPCTIEASIVVANPTLRMVLPHNDAVANAAHQKRKKKSSTKTCVNKRKRPPTTTSTSTANTLSSRCARFGIGSNDPLPRQIVHPAPFHQDIGAMKPQHIQCRYQGRNVPS
ncbi:uncharacterized protein LOC120665623 isoform X4 [Panicum virgatum]|uniref:uncharacterized protein LOC120665623 isoform X4 n=1 Tax=Panicum virgatum TaxID=38727 RepID=UPI0019D68721|nr:uncharacterized protein LOC120665623 isoform X4 [Panicum virgatum]